MWESWARPTECAECGRDVYLVGVLCRPCRVGLGIDPEEDDE